MATAGIEPIAFEPHMLEKDKPSDAVLQRTWGLEARTDPSVTFEEYVHWAKSERAEEMENERQYIADAGPTTVSKLITGRFSKGVHHDNKKKRAEEAKSMPLQDVKGGSPGATDVTKDSMSAVSDQEWKTAARALRTASWGTIL